MSEDWRPPAPDGPYRVGLVLVPEFSLMAFSSAVEPLRSANLVTGRPLYEWVFLSPAGGTVRASCGLEVATGALAEAAERCAMLLVVGGIATDRYHDPALAAFLRRCHRTGTVVGAVSTGSFVLARAGLLEGRRCTVHWDYQGAFEECFPEIEVASALFVLDKGVVTCAGGTAAIDLILHLIRLHHGDAVSDLVSDQFIHGVRREPAAHQRMPARDRLRSASPVLLKAVALMEASLDTRLSCAEIAREVVTSVRNLERVFKHAVRTSPRQYYLQLRLERARQLLRHTSLSVTQIAVACGFESLSHFSKSYSRHFATSPTRDRQGGSAPERRPGRGGEGELRPSGP